MFTPLCAVHIVDTYGINGFARFVSQLTLAYWSLAALSLLQRLTSELCRPLCAFLATSTDIILECPSRRMPQLVAAFYLFTIALEVAHYYACPA